MKNKEKIVRMCRHIEGILVLSESCAPWQDDGPIYWEIMQNFIRLITNNNHQIW